MLNQFQLRTDAPHVVFQECPNEVALCFRFYGCPIACDGCHSTELWDEQGGNALTLAQFCDYLEQYKGLITAVVFFGGEWKPFALQALLKTTRRYGLKTCLYSGLNNLSKHLKPYLDFAKLGPWKAEFGGLDSSQTNQRFYQIKNGEISSELTHLFQPTHPYSNNNPCKETLYA